MQASLHIRFDIGRATPNHCSDKRVCSLCDIPFDKNTVKAGRKRMKLYLSPMNALSALAQASVPPDVKVID